MAKRKKIIKDDLAQKDYRFMTALARGLSVLRAFGPQNRPIGNGEIAKRVGLAKPTVSRITFTLTELGYLKFDEETGFYQLGPGVLALGYDVVAQMEIRDIARPYMQELANYADASVYLGIPSGLEIIYVEACRSPATMAIRLGVGSRIPLPTTGMGRAYLSALPKEELEKLRPQFAKQFDSKWPQVEKEMDKALELAQKRGFSMTVGGWVSEANSAGAAIRRSDGFPVYTVNVGGLRSIITAELLENELGPRVLKIARKIEKVALGML